MKFALCLEAIVWIKELFHFEVDFEKAPVLDPPRYRHF